VFIIGVLLGVGVSSAYHWDRHRVASDQRRKVTAYANTLADRGFPVAFVDPLGGGFWRVIYVGGACEEFDARGGGAPSPAGTCDLGISPTPTTG
jgi:hypothetical protein